MFLDDYVFNINDFVCADPTDEVIAQAYMDQFVAFQLKKPKKPYDEIIYEAMGGKDNYKEAKKEIKKWEKEIKKNFPDMVPQTDVSDLEDEDEDTIDEVPLP